MLISTIILLCHAAGLLTAYKAIMDTRTAQGTIAWAISLITCPYVAVPAYWVFGRTKFTGYVSARRAEFVKTNALARELNALLMQERVKDARGRGADGPLERIAKLPFTGHNQAELLIDGDATFGAIFDEIDRAQHYVLVQFFIIHDDGLGRRLKDALIAASKRNVRCYVLYDEIGTRRLDDYVAALRANGVHVQPFHTTKGPANRFQLNFRNHRKIVIVDGKSAFVGGHNVGDEYMGLDPKFGPWRDTHVKVVGPVVQCVQVSWAEDWHWATGHVPPLHWRPERAPESTNESTNARAPGSTYGGVGALCLPSGPADELETATLFFLHAINSAQRRLWIASPYFVPDMQFISALQLAALRGVDVRILIPKNPDHPLVWLSAHAYLPETEAVGIKWFRYSRGFMHQKVMLVDEDYCSVGTANFDNRSFRLNFEITMAFSDAGFARQVEAMLERDFAASIPAKADELTNASRWFKLKVRVARLLSPIQ